MPEISDKYKKSELAENSKTWTLKKQRPGKKEGPFDFITGNKFPAGNIFLAISRN
ncbi:hypothetical protein [Anoxynatronum sibiricum]|uniref:hypothetical protein n=1 Tax=Anoxynatronum sibiricum TaxID=210623 RepID=UPI0031B81967